MPRQTGDTPHGSTDQGNPNKIGGYAKDTAPTAVSAGQRVNAWFDLYGRIAAFISGDVAHDAADAGNPIKIGGYGKATAPTVASTAGDRVNAWFDLYGRLASFICGDTAHDAADSGAPVKVGAYGSATAPSAASADGDRVNLWCDLYGRLASFICGDTAHDAADSGAPVKIGGKATTSAPTAISATNDRVNAYFDAYGRQVVVSQGAYQDAVRTHFLSADASGAVADISAAPGASLKIVMDKIVVSTGAAIDVTIKEETSGTVIAVLHMAVDQTVVLDNLGKLPVANKKLQVQTSGAGAVGVTTLCRYEA